MAEVGVNSEIWRNWERQGKADFLKTCKLTVKENTGSIGLNVALSRAIYELVWHGIRGPLRRDATVATIGELSILHCELPSLILDVFSVIDAETSSTDGHSDDRNRFCFIAKECEKYLSEKLLKERLEIDTLQDCGTLKNKGFYTKFIKVKTKLYYKQRKFNLFREESEGYAKLITELNQDVSENVTVQNILEIIKSLIGCFNLDPNRALDIILESFECRLDHHQFFIPLLRSYMPDPKILCEVLGFKFCFYQNGTEEETPASLFTVAALMLQYDIIALDDIYSWLTPDDKLIYKDWEREVKESKDYVRKLNVISTKDKEKEEVVEEKEPVKESYVQNQKFGLCEALLRVGDWRHAEQLTRKLPEHCALDQPPVARALCRLLHAIIEPVYRRNCMLGPDLRGTPAPPLDSPLAPPQCNTFEDLKEFAVPMLVALGASIQFDPILMHKVLRMSRAALSQKGSGDTQGGRQTDCCLYYDVLTILDEVLLPALSFMDCNCCVAEEVWNLLKLYPYQQRYCLYSRWKNDTHQNNAKLLRKRADAVKKIKSLMKRVSKENIKPVGRLLGKLTHSSPGCVFDYMLLQIQIYDNLINPVVDSLKYLTSLSYDVLGYCLVESLASVDRERVKHDGTSISLWLQSLAAFCGAIFKKYNIELTGLLQFVANQLKAQKSLDLLILKEIVQKMAGIEAAEEMTAEQLEALAGGELLKGEAGYFSQVRNTKKPSQRLKETLAEQDLAVTLCLLMAQQRYCTVYKEADQSHLKLVGKLYDQCQDTLVQFGTFLVSAMSMDEYVNKFPSIHKILSEFHIHADVAFFLARPTFTHAINARYETLRKADPGGKKLSQAAKHQKYWEAAREVMDPIVALVRPLHPPKVWEDISPQFFVTFWSLTMYDLFVPVESYAREINKLRQLSLQAMEAKDMAGSKGKKEQEKHTLLMEKLQEERKKQQEHVERVLARLKQEKDSWFLLRSAKAAKNETITQFLQLCIFPRCTFTAADAIFCAKFVLTIHSLKTANFSTLLCYDRLFCDITYSVTSCTENEANRYGRFLCAMLETVMRWHAEKATFEKECANYPGFVTKFRVSNTFSEANDHVGYENYRHVCHKWHYKITKAMVMCLDSKDYVQIRNALIILIKILPHFPVLSKLSQIIERKIEKVKEEEKNQRQDLYILATSYIGQLKSKAATMIKENDFHQVNEKPSKSETVSIASKQDLNITGPQQIILKQVNGDLKSDKERPVEKVSGEKKEAVVREPKESRSEKRSSVRQQNELLSAKVAPPSSAILEGKRDNTPGRAGVSPTRPSKDKADREKTKDKEYEVKEKVSKKEDGGEREKRSKDRKDEKAAAREERLAAREERAREERAREERAREERAREERAREERAREERAREERAREERAREERERVALRESSQREERSSQREERSYREERYIEIPVAAKDDARYSSYYSSERDRDRERAHYYAREERDISSLSNSSSGSPHCRPQDPPEPDRELKRRKLDGGSSSKSSKLEERKLEPLSTSGGSEKLEKKERSSKGKEKSQRDKGTTEEEKELRKERKLGRKRDRAEEALLVAEQKRRKEEEKAALKLSHQNGEPVDSHMVREKHHYREKSPYLRERERSHDREGRDKHRRSSEGKRR